MHLWKHPAARPSIVVHGRSLDSPYHAVLRSVGLSFRIPNHRSQRQPCPPGLPSPHRPPAPAATPSRRRGGPTRRIGRLAPCLVCVSSPSRPLSSPPQQR